MTDPFPLFKQAIDEYKRDSIKDRINIIKEDLKTIEGFINKPLVIQFYSISKIRVCNITDDELQQHLAEVSLMHFKRRLVELEKELNQL